MKTLHAEGGSDSLVNSCSARVQRRTLTFTLPVVSVETGPSFLNPMPFTDSQDSPDGAASVKVTYMFEPAQVMQWGELLSGILTSKHLITGFASFNLYFIHSVSVLWFLSVLHKELWKAWKTGTCFYSFNTVSYERSVCISGGHAAALSPLDTGPGAQLARMWRFSHGDKHRSIRKELLSLFRIFISV